MRAAGDLGCETVQLFLRAPGRWAAATLADDEIVRFRAESRRTGLAGAGFAHAPYLLNLASADDALRQRSLAVLVEELERAGALGLAGVVLHPGSAGGGVRGEAIARCRAALAEALDRAGEGAARVLLEGTAGAGGQLGTSPAELRALVPVGAAGRVGLCLDTAHLWGAGYDLRGDGWERVLGEVGEAWSRPAPELLHGNDTPVELGSHRDRHAPPGEGQLGDVFFRHLLTDERCARVPLVVEIPPGEDNREVATVLNRLRDWSCSQAPSKRARRPRG